MDCRTFKKLFSPFLDGALDESNSAVAREHLSVCPFCARLVSAYRAGTDNLARTRQIDPPDDLFDAVMSAVKTRPATALKHPGGALALLRPRFVLPGLAAAALALAFGFFLRTGGPEPREAQYYTLVDSTMDMINYQVAEQLARKENTQRMKAVQLASFAPSEEETAQKSGVNRHPVIILSGVSDFSE
jgi:hypothetical protein